MLAIELDGAILSEIDIDAFEALKEVEAEERDALVAKVMKL